MAQLDASARTEYTLSRLNRLPAFSDTAVKLLVRPFGDNESISVVEALFRSDPAMASQLLAAANSAAMGLRTHVGTLRHALAVLGFDRIRALVVTIATSSYMRQFPADVVRPVWSHSIATAVIAEQLAGYSDRLSGAALYTAGLTHDLGRLGLLAADPRRYAPFLQTEFQDRDDSEQCEWEQFGVIHTVAGGLLGQLWGFPENLCGHCENHHAKSGFDTEEDRIVHTACLLADAIGFPELRQRSAPEPEGLDALDDSCRLDVAKRIQAFFG